MCLSRAIRRYSSKLRARFKHLLGAAATGRTSKVMDYYSQNGCATCKLCGYEGDYVAQALSGPAPHAARQV
jgi:hypothetical protein